MFSIILLDCLVRLLLVIASVASFVPQVKRMKRHGDCHGISISYLLLNLIVATYNFTMIFAAATEGEDNVLFSQPPGAGDWLNVAQFTVTGLGHLVLLYLAVTLPPRRIAQRTAIAAYLSFLTISLVPAIGVALIPQPDRDWPSIFLQGLLIILLSPLVQLLGGAAFVVQFRAIRRGSSDSLSIRGLVMQAVVFFLVGISFLFRYVVPSEESDEPFIVRLWSGFAVFGWATINNLIFALAQGMLALVVLRQRGDGLGERAALLAT